MLRALQSAALLQQRRLVSQSAVLLLRHTRRAASFDATAASATTTTAAAADHSQEDGTVDRRHLTARALAERNDLPLSEAVSLFQQTVRQRREHHLREAQRLIFPASASHAAHSEADSESSFWGPERFGSLPSEALEVLRDDEKPLEALDRPLRDAYQTVFAELRSQGVITNKEWLPLLRTALTRYADTPLEVSAEVADYARATLKDAYREPDKWRPLPPSARVVTNDRGTFDQVSELFLHTSKEVSLAHLEQDVTFVPRLEDDELLDYRLADRDEVEPDHELVEDPPDMPINEAAVTRYPRIAENGTASGVGRRKSAVCRAVIAPLTEADLERDGRGLLSVNGKSLVEYFSQLQAREAAVQPLLVTEAMSKFRVRCSVRGGGFHGTSRALSQASNPIRTHARAHTLSERSPSRSRLAGDRPSSASIRSNLPCTAQVCRLAVARPTTRRAQEARSSKGQGQVRVGQALNQGPLHSPHTRNRTHSLTQ